MSRDFTRPTVINGIDFARYHPLDHSLWSCQYYFGGRVQHLRCQWRWNWGPTLRTHTLCRVGLHSSGFTPTMAPICLDCHRSLA